MAKFIRISFTELHSPSMAIIYRVYRDDINVALYIFQTPSLEYIYRFLCQVAVLTCIGLCAIEYTGACTIGCAGVCASVCAIKCGNMFNAFECV